MKSTATLFFVFAFLFTCQFANSQTVPQHSPDSRTILQKGIDQYDNGQYKEAVKTYETIHRNDTNYVLSLYEKALALEQDSAYNEALATINLALQQDFNESFHDYLMLKGNILDDMGQPEAALKLYDSIQKIYPASVYIRSQKVTTLYRLKRYAEAEAMARECVTMSFLNPLYHYKLGFIAYAEGKMVPAMMAFTMANIVEPNNANKKRIVTYLSNICNASDEAVEYQQKREGDYPDIFNRVEQIVFSKIAFDKAYKTKFNLDDKIFKQINVMMEKLEFDENADDPFMQLYVPFFKQVFQGQQAEVMLNHAFSGLEVSEIESYIKKNKTEVTNFKTLAYNYCNLIRSTRVVNFNERQKASEVFHYDENRFFGNGRIENEKGEGDWKFYFSDGRVKAEGKLLGNEKEGVWKFYYEIGELQSVEEYKNGLSDGPVTVYYENGIVKKTMTYKDDKLEGTMKLYNRYGVLLSEENYNNGEANGVAKYYYNDGRNKSEFNYKDGKLNGPFTVYYPSQAVKEKGTYAAGELDGTYKKFYINGQVENEFQYAAGKTTGMWKSYHRNGKLYYQVNMTDKGKDGEMISYDDQGKIESKEIYKDGSATGSSDFYFNGKVYLSFKNNSRGKTSEVRYFDSTGAELVQNKRNGKNWKITYYSPYQYKTAEKVFDQQEQLTDEAVYFNAIGDPVTRETYKDGELTGTKTSLYYNKQLKEESEFAAGKRDGYYKSYYVNGTLSTVAFYKEDVLEDYSYDYNSKGILQSLFFYAEGEKHGIAQVFYPNGKLFYEEKYSHGWIQQVTQYDTTGKPMHTIKFEKGKGVYKLFYPNGKVYYELPVENGIYQGIQKLYYPNGAIMSEVTFKNDQKEGPAKYYHPNGKISSEGSFLNDGKEGIWKSYTEDGLLDELEQYADGYLEGLCKYYDKGKLTREIEYKQGSRNGAMKRYSMNGELAYVLFYDDGLITSYTYLDKNKKLLPVTWLKNLTGNIETYYSNGTKSASIGVNAGHYHGKFNLFNEKGVLVFESTDEFGFSNGETKTYHENGKLMTINSVAYDIETGVAKEFYPDGKIKWETTYEAGNVNGPFKVYDATGKLVETRLYYYGYIIDIKK